VITYTLASVYQRRVTETSVNVSLLTKLSALFIGTAISPLEYPVLISTPYSLERSPSLPSVRYSATLMSLISLS